jgi:hypothetical protein
VRRVAITLDEHALAELTRRAQAAEEPVARTAARLVRDGLISTHAHVTAGEPPNTTTSMPAEGQSATSAPGWLQPPGDGRRERWRRELWAGVRALAERYPPVMAKLPADWWKDRALIEVMGALIAWRAQLDTGQSTDPRAELLFHDRLDLLDRQLTHTGDPTAARFTGGPPPSEWVAG